MPSTDADRPAPLTTAGNVFVAPSPTHGLGVFAARRLEPDETIERCPVVVCPAADEALLGETALRGLYFSWSGGDLALALGYGSLYNHAWEPNAAYETDFVGGLVHLWALRPVGEGEEITINYTGTPGGRGDLWFDVGT